MGYEICASWSKIYCSFPFSFHRILHPRNPKLTWLPFRPRSLMFLDKQLEFTWAGWWVNYTSRTTEFELYLIKQHPIKSSSSHLLLSKSENSWGSASKSSHYYYYHIHFSLKETEKPSGLQIGSFLQQHPCFSVEISIPWNYCQIVLCIIHASQFYYNHTNELCTLNNTETCVNYNPTR